MSGSNGITLNEHHDDFLAASTLFTGDEWGIPPTVLSLVTNVTATGLIAYKAWCVP